ncbi:hypothetical protein GN956_G9004 [Arapaima gigas]
MSAIYHPRYPPFAGLPRHACHTCVTSHASSQETLTWSCDVILSALKGDQQLLFTKPSEELLLLHSPPLSQRHSAGGASAPPRRQELPPSPARRDEAWFSPGVRVTSPPLAVRAAAPAGRWTVAAGPQTPGVCRSDGGGREEVG